MIAKRTQHVIRGDELYSKGELLNRMGISQKAWDQMLNNGLPVSQIGKCKWVSGHDLIAYHSQHARTRSEP